MESPGKETVSQVRDGRKQAFAKHEEDVQLEMILTWDGSLKGKGIRDDVDEEGERDAPAHFAVFLPQKMWVITREQTRKHTFHSFELACWRFGRFETFPFQGPR
jgi:hypothetical protein